MVNVNNSIEQVIRKLIRFRRERFRFSQTDILLSVIQNIIIYLMSDISQDKNILSLRRD